MDGAKMPRLRTVDLEAFELSVPPLDEQARISEAIKMLTSKVNQARRLHSECMIEAATILRATIEDRFSEFKGEYRPLQSFLLDKPRNGWSPPSDGHAAEGTPVLTLSAVTGFRYDCSKIKWTSAATQAGVNYWLKPRELLITRSNVPELVGHAAIYDGTPEHCICPDLIMKMTVDPEKADVRFVHYWLQSKVARDYLVARARGTSGTMKKINQGHVQRIPVPQVPLRKQQQIVEHLESLRERVDRLEERFATMDSELKSFTPALLAKAFRGEL